MLLLRRCTRITLRRGLVYGTARNLSTPGGSLSVQTLPELQGRPKFAIPSQCVSILERPAEFYLTLLNMIRGARKRILISSLYVGTEETELMGAIYDALATNPALEIHFLLDLNRSTRLEGKGYASTAHMLLPLIQKYPNNVSVNMFRSPKLKGVLAKLVPPRFNEGWGTWHAKIYAADDDFMISGANLNKSYFQDRQDRYLHFQNQPAMAEYLSAFLDTLSNFSFRLGLPSSSSPSRHSMEPKDGVYRLSWPNVTTHPHHFEQEAGAALKALQLGYAESAGRQDGENDTVIYPLIQSGVLGVREEEAVLSSLFETLLRHGQQDPEHRSTIDLTSGYFALYEPYQVHSLKQGLDWRVLAASPKANGFYGSKGVSGHIPGGYTLLEQRFWKRVLQAGRVWNDKDGGVQLSEWLRDGWTYHAKGVWVSQNASPTSPPAPSVTLFGSTNLNSRSANLDTELSFLMETQSPALRERLGKEVQSLWKDATPVGEEVWRSQGRRMGGVPYSTRALVSLVGSML